MKQTDKGKEAFELIIAFMASIFLIYPAMKDVFEIGNMSLQENIPLQALSASVIFAGGIIILFLLVLMYFNKK